MTRTAIRRLALTLALVGAAVLISGSSGRRQAAQQGAAEAGDDHPRHAADRERLPLDLGIKQGFFAKQGIEIKKTLFQSGNDIVLAMANSNGDIGYIGWVPAMIARTQGIPLVTASASDIEATSIDDNWQNILVKGNSSIRTPKDLAGKTIAVNALKGVGEVVIRAALCKVGVDPNSVKFLAIPFPAMRSALNNGQVDAICAPEPFMSQALTLDGGRIVMAPGPMLGNYWPNGGYVRVHDWAKEPQAREGVPDAINQSLPTPRPTPTTSRRCCRRRPGTSGCRSGAR